MDIMGISRTTAYKIVNEHGIPTMRIGRLIRIDKNGFDKWRNRMLK